MYNYEHFTVNVNDESRLFEIIAKPHVLSWRVMPANVARDIEAAVNDWRKRGYRQAKVGEEVVKEQRSLGADAPDEPSADYYSRRGQYTGRFVD
ncbi:MAG: hypothetical protein GWN58_13630 [Anaerolineae bacterium]|nr:hypothetical protein [Anaerolineae bacterium]